MREKKDGWNDSGLKRVEINHGTLFLSPFVEPEA